MPRSPSTPNGSSRSRSRIWAIRGWSSPRSCSRSHSIPFSGRTGTQAAMPFAFRESFGFAMTSRSTRSTLWTASPSFMTATSVRSPRCHSAMWRKRDGEPPHPAASPPTSPASGEVKLTFMGTAGARFMVAKQVAASGGLYIEEGDTRMSLDPGPGAIVQYAQRGIDLTTLDAIVVSHRHLDHAGDLNVMVEGMTDGGFAHRGMVFCPSDALDDDPVMLKYLRRFPREIVRLAPETSYTVGDIAFTTSGRHVHQVETYGFRFGNRLGWVTDSAYYDGIAEQHRADVMVLHTILLHCRPDLPHLCVADVERIIRDAEPKLAFLTHYGMTVWRADPAAIAADLTQRTGVEVRAATDGLSIEL